MRLFWESKALGLTEDTWTLGAGAARTERNPVLSEDAATRAERVLNCIVAQFEEMMIREDSGLLVEMQKWFSRGREWEDSRYKK